VILELQRSRPQHTAAPALLDEDHRLQVAPVPAGGDGQPRSAGEPGPPFGCPEDREAPDDSGVVETPARILAPEDLGVQPAFGDGQEHVGRVSSRHSG
jgi:hypothetical protein